MSYDPNSLPDLLPIYYKRIFPYAPYYRWLNYGGGKFQKRSGYVSEGDTKTYRAIQGPQLLRDWSVMGNRGGVRLRLDSADYIRLKRASHQLERLWVKCGIA